MLAIFVLLPTMVGTASAKTFAYNEWGSYYTANYQGQEYFAGYSVNSIIGQNIILQEDQLHTVLLDTNNAISSVIGESKTLQEEYAFKVIDMNISDKVILLSLLKNDVEIDRTVIHAGDTYIYRKAKVGNISDLPLILIHLDSVFQGATEKIARFNGIFQISESISIEPAYKSFVDDVYGFYRVIHPSKSVTYNDNILTINTGETVIWVSDSNDYTLTIVSEQGLWNDTDAKLRWSYQQFGHRFDTEGEYSVYIKEFPALKHQKIVVKSVLITPIPTVTFTPIPTVTFIPIPAVTFIPVQTNVIPTATVTATQETNKRAILEVTNKIDRSDNGAIITINLRNTGDDTARFVKFSSEIPAELGMVLLSGANRNGNELIWRGDIEAGNEHQIVYKVKPVKIDISIPIKVTYVKDSGTASKIMSKAAAEGIRSENILDNIDPQDLQTILLIIQIGKALLPGFEVMIGIGGILAIYVLRKRN